LLLPSSIYTSGCVLRTYTVAAPLRYKRSTVFLTFFTTNQSMLCKDPVTREKIYLTETHQLLIFPSFLCMSPEIISALTHSFLTSFCVDQVYGEIVFVFTQSRNKPFSKSDQIKPFQKPSISHRKPKRNSFKKDQKKPFHEKLFS
jgi:hypothetical protein